MDLRDAESIKRIPLPPGAAPGAVAALEERVRRAFDPAGLANPGQAAPDLAQGCVPVNMFAPSLVSTFVGDLASAAERDSQLLQWLQQVYNPIDRLLARTV